MPIKIVFWHEQYPKTAHSEVPEFSWINGKRVVRLRAYNVYEITPRAIPNENNEPATYKRPYHLVKQGETWDVIEKEAGVNRYALQWENGLDEATPLDTLVGKKIYFPRGTRKLKPTPKTPSTTSGKSENKQANKKASSVPKQQEQKAGGKKEQNQVIQARSENNGKPVDVLEDKEDNQNGYYYEAVTGYYHNQITENRGNINDVYIYLDFKGGRYIGVKKLSIKDHSEFITKSSTIYGESSAFRATKISKDELKKEMYAIASVHQKNKKAYGISSALDKIFRSKSCSDRNGTNMQFAIAALINALSNGHDYSYGADMWDGMEQAMYSGSDNRRSTGRFELHMNTMGWDISQEHYEKWKNSVNTLLGQGKFLAPQKKTAPENYGNYKNKGKMRLKSTAVYNGTIFWSSK
ncbi:hypothetical protein [Rodentibacter pneumotropicus]|uniref:hypothetical protein n=1 Tax=Rodentibacter pneumotropicus TaxID=758 RepID=UPI00109D69F1|nr:hypothetical protein [Rodentibacter pneumotropicus]THA01926.1 hypothetical protein D3M74_04610 [Rodentibacter pneumotropicus]